MRVWDVHPGYLSRQSLLGEHAEIHTLYSIVSQKKSAYARHPETRRWSGHLEFLQIRHELVIKEMTLRGFSHHSPCPSPNEAAGVGIGVGAEGGGENESVISNRDRDGSREGKLVQVSFVDLPEIQFAILGEKYEQKGQRGRIPLPVTGLEFWAHHKYSVMSRSYAYYREVQRFMRGRQSHPISGEHDLIFFIYRYMEKSVTSWALDRVIEHIWGYFKRKASLQEKADFFSLRDVAEKMSILFKMAKKYQEDYLLHATIFADFLVPGELKNREI